MSELLYHFPGPRFMARDAINQAFRRGSCHPLMLMTTFAIGAGSHWVAPRSEMIFAGLVGVWIMLSLGVPLSCAGIVSDRRCPFRDVIKATFVAFSWAAIVNAVGFFFRARYLEHADSWRALFVHIDDAWLLACVFGGVCFICAIAARLCAPNSSF